MRPDLATIETVLPGDLDVAWQSGENVGRSGLLDRRPRELRDDGTARSRRRREFDDDFAICRCRPRRDRAFEVRR